ncbi:MAG: PilZ domain-containing protein [Myxococcaceae bacterium]
MHDAFSKSGSVSSVLNRTGRTSPAGKFSPSFGVRHGLIKDPNWPPAEFPEGGSATSRRFRRVEAKFEVSVQGALMPVKGDVSQGGAMFQLDRRLDVKHVDVVVQGKVARAEIVSCSKKGAAFAHHCRFLDIAQSQVVWQVIASS